MNKDLATSLGILLALILIIGFGVYLLRVNQPAKSDIATNSELDAPESTMTETTNKTTQKSYTKEPEMAINKDKNYSAIITTSLGVIKIDLSEKTAPKTVNNFVFLAKEGFYNNTFFHRVIDGFMIQGGDPTGTGSGSPGYRFDDEILEGEYTRGTIAMANSGPNTNGSQFFLMHADYPLPNNYVIFGKALDDESLKTIDAIATSKVSLNKFGEKSTPTERTFITSVEIVEN